MMDITLSQDDVRRVQTAMDRLFEKTNMTAQRAVMKAGYMLARSASAYCKPGASKHEVVRNPNLAQSVYAGVKLTQPDGKRTLFPVSSPTDPDLRIRRRGFARASWQLAAVKFSGRGSSRKLSGSLSGRLVAVGVRKYVWVSPIMGGAMNPEVRLRNRVSYMLKAYPGVVQHAVRAGMTALVATFDKEYARELKKSWA
jgi:hypothetical protein